MARIDDTKAKIIEVASNLFKRYGFEKTSMDEIAKVAHKAKGSLYYHFESKEVLFKTIVDKEIEKLKVALAPLFTDDRYTEVERINLYIIKRMELLNKAYSYHEVLKNEVVAYYGIESNAMFELRKPFDDWERGQMIAVISQAINKKCLDVKLKAESVADMLIMVLKSLDVQFFVKNEYFDYKDSFEALIRIVMNGLAKEMSL